MIRKPHITLFWILAALGLASPWGLDHWLGDWFGDWFGDGFGDWFGTTTSRSCQVSSIHDGDTLRGDCDGANLSVRFYCIDAPEIAQRPWGTESRDHLRAMTPKTIRLVEHDKDRYGRIVGEIYAGERSLNLAMVEAGQAAVYPAYCKESRFFDAERRARDAGLGIWAKPGDQQQPWEYRRQKRAN
jgi:endonuclease YncB( thermonuclease family)